MHHDSTQMGQATKRQRVAYLLPLPTDLKIGWKYCVWNWKAPNSRFSVTPLVANRINLRFEAPLSELGNSHEGNAVNRRKRCPSI